MGIWSLMMGDTYAVTAEPRRQYRGACHVEVVEPLRVYSPTYCDVHTAGRMAMRCSSAACAVLGPIMTFGARGQSVRTLASRQQRSHQPNTYATDAKVIGCTPSACPVCSERNGEGCCERSDSSYPSETYCTPNFSTPQASVGHFTFVRRAIVLDVAVVVLCVYLLWRQMGSTQRHQRTMSPALPAPISCPLTWNVSM